MVIIRNPFRSIRGKLILTLIVLLVLPTLIFIWSYTQSSKKLVEEEVYESNQLVVERSVQAIIDMMERMIKATAFAELDINQTNPSELTEWKEDYTAYFKYKTLQHRFSMVRDLLLDSNAFMLYLDYHGLEVSTLQDFEGGSNYESLKKEPWYQSALAAGGYPAWSFYYQLKPGYGHTHSEVEQQFMVASRTIRDEDSGISMGVVAIGVPMDIFFKDQIQIGENQLPQLILKDQQGSVYDPAGNQLKQLEAALRSNQAENKGNSTSLDYGGRTYLLNEAPLSQTGMDLIRLMPSDQLTRQLEQTKNRSILTLSLIFMLAVALFLFLIIRFTRPIYSLLHSMNLVGSGDFQAEVEVKGKDEISLLGYNFNKMIYRLRELLSHVKEEQRKKEEARFQALQAQINPHFLFNTLNSIKLMAMLSNTNRNVSDMITALGKLLEFSMKQQQQFVTLQEELEYLELYMSLQKMRYQDNINILMEIPEQLAACYVLKFCLQPLVENSIIHGGKFPLNIWIGAELDSSGEVYSIIVRDNGKGVPDEVLAKIRDKMTHSHAKYSGIGVSNVDQRIKLHFGPNYGITLRNAEAGGLEALVRLPIRKELPES
jgi:two-component system, sensor histidine kinase YesM